MLQLASSGRKAVLDCLRHGLHVACQNNILTAPASSHFNEVDSLSETTMVLQLWKYVGACCAMHFPPPSP